MLPVRPGPARQGFTLIELLVVITIIGILAAIALPNYIRAKDKAKEVQAKSAVKSIQVAIERYHTDFEKYPQYLMGGDREGWRVWHQRYDEPNPGRLGVFNANVKDILLEHGYLDSYPRNPFIDNGNSVIQQTGNATGPGGSFQPGDGDPRFGLRGDSMGSGLDVPQIFRNWYNYDTLNFATERVLIAILGDPRSKGFATPEGAIDNPQGGSGLHYCMGGRRGRVVENGQQRFDTVFVHWPGNFFYRGLGEHDYSRKGWTIYLPNAFIKREINRYLMGVYGSYQSEGVDIIRLERRDRSNNQLYYRFPPPWASNFTWPLGYNPASGGHGLPEISGGGNATQGPWYPPNRAVDFPNEWIYGAPDGYPDAVVLVLHAGAEVMAF